MRQPVHDDDLSALFAKARQAEQGAAPRFDPRPVATERRPDRAPIARRMGWLAAAAGVTVALAATWLAVKTPGPAVVPTSDTTTRSPGAAAHALPPPPAGVSDLARPPAGERAGKEEVDARAAQAPQASEPERRGGLESSIAPSKAKAGEGETALPAAPGQRYAAPGGSPPGATAPNETPVTAKPADFQDIGEITASESLYQKARAQLPDPNAPRDRDFEAVVPGSKQEGPMTGALAPTPNPGLQEQFVNELPVPGRHYQNVLKLAPGAQREGMGGVVGGVVGGVFGAAPVARNGFARLGEAEDPALNTEGYAPIEESRFLSVAQSPLSTFSIDVDTASYANVRRFLLAGQLPPADAVRIEELINYFPYAYPAPTDDAPFSVQVDVAGCPWKPEHRLARIGLKGRELDRRDRAGSNLVFLIDVSGSMDEPRKLPLLKSALALLVQQLSARDQVAIVVYAGSSGLVLPATAGSDAPKILEAIDHLEAGGSTNGGEGLRLAYRIAREQFIPGGVNRVVLATDGDFNVGVTSSGELQRMLEKDAATGIFLTALGFGYGNLRDDRLEHLADRGNGNYAYIDTLSEARKVLVDELQGTLVTIAKDVKIQVEFNPLLVGSYRLIGYENRALRSEDFHDDRRDAGEIGAGHTVTALYELIPPGAVEAQSATEPLRYRAPAEVSAAARSGELLTVKLRYKDPEGTESRLVVHPARDSGTDIEAAGDDFKFAAAVAEFGMLLRRSAFAGAAQWESVERLASAGVARDPGGYRAEFLDLVRRARDIDPVRSESRP